MDRRAWQAIVSSSDSKETRLSRLSTTIIVVGEKKRKGQQVALSLSWGHYALDRSMWTGKGSFRLK